MLRLALILPLALSACPGDETIAGYVDPGAIYRLAEVDGVAFEAQATIRFPAEGTLAGRTPCNAYSARVTLPLPWFGIDDVAVTRRACPELAAETAYLAALRAMTLAEVAGGVLILSNDAGREIVFRAE